MAVSWFIQPFPIDGLMGYIQSFDILNSAVMKSHVHLSFFVLFCKGVIGIYCPKWINAHTILPDIINFSSPGLRSLCLPTSETFSFTLVDSYRLLYILQNLSPISRFPGGLPLSPGFLLLAFPAPGSFLWLSPDTERLGVSVSNSILSRLRAL